MQGIYDGLILYHGSYCEVKNPDLAKCAKSKDFGKGFYLTSSKEQAVNFLKTSIAKAITKGDISSEQNWGYISTFKIISTSNVACHIFKTADTDWLHCIAAFRKRGSFPVIEEQMNKNDVIIGKIANDQTNATLAAYIGGAFGSIGSASADKFCISQLLPDKLKDQYCFKTAQALNCLEFEGSEKVWIQ